MPSINSQNLKYLWSAAVTLLPENAESSEKNAENADLSEKNAEVG
jgi:hypothetical protein